MLLQGSDETRLELMFVEPAMNLDPTVAAGLVDPVLLIDIRGVKMSSADAIEAARLFSS